MLVLIHSSRRALPLLGVVLLLCVSLQCETNEETANNDLKAPELEEEDIMYVEDEESVPEEANIFEPTSEWKVVEKGQYIPSGLHVRMNLQTGLKEAKLLEENEVVEVNNSGEGDQRSDPTYKESVSFGKDRRRVNHYGKSDRRGIVNKRTKVFSKKELAKMLEKINDDSGDPQQLLITAGDDRTTDKNNQPSLKLSEGSRISVQDSEASEQELPVSFHSDTELMLEHSRTLARNGATVSELVHALEELEYYVHQIDNALDLNDIGGLVLVVRLLNHSNPEVKSSAAHVIGSAAQSNPTLQQLALDYGSLLLLCRMISSTEADLVQRRALFALGTLLRGNSEQQLLFIEQCGGFRLLGDSFHARADQVQLKAITLLTDILNEQSEPHSATMSSQGGRNPVILLHLLNQVFDHGWCDHVTTIVHSHDPNRIEKGLQAMDALKTTCDFSNQTRRLKQLARYFESTLETESEGDDDYTQLLLEYCRTLLKRIRQHSLDL